MNDARPRGGRKPVRIRPNIPPADYTDEISPEAFQKLRAEVADLNAPDRKRTIIAGMDIP
jgi:hypothetical protein